MLFNNATLNKINTAKPWSLLSYWILLILFNLGLIHEHGDFYSAIYFLVISVVLLLAYYVKNIKLRHIFSLVSTILILASMSILDLEMEQVEEAFVVLPVLFVLLYPGKIYASFLSFAFVALYFFHPGDESFDGLVEDSLEMIIISSLAVIVSYQYKRIKEKIKTLETESYCDDLTLYPNRKAFLRDMNSEITEEKKFEVLILDIDNFKTINDNFGHLQGDGVLIAVSKLLSSLTSSETRFYRIASDEFSFICELDESEKIARVIKEISEKSFYVNEYEHNISFSIGSAKYPLDASTWEGIYNNSALALQVSKINGRNRYTSFKSKMRQEIANRYKLIEELRFAIDNDEFIVYYQPKNNILTNKIVSAEALVRWNHPEKGLVSPYRFIPIAEETGLIKEIGKSVLRKACIENVKWQKNGYPNMKVSVNLSAVQLKSENIIETVKDVLNSTGLSGKYLELEVTESTLMDDIDLSVGILNSLRELGVILSMDDFGVAYSSFTYLKQLPIDTLKLDRTFVKDLDTSHSDRMIAKTIIELGHNLDINVIAEGVETKSQLDFLKNEGCDEYQGYIMSRPLPGEDFFELLGKNK